MRRVLQYIIGEVKEGRLSKSSAVELTRDISAQVVPAQSPVLHRLLHRNTSTFSAQRFSTKLDGDEFYLRDHVVGGLHVLPGVAQLEMARAAVEAATAEDGRRGIRLQQVVWLRPVVVGSDGIELHIELFAEEDGKLEYEIYSETEDRVIHSQGRVVLGPIGRVANVDVGALQMRCSDRAFSAEQSYARFEMQGLNYGPSFRGIRDLSVGVDAVGRTQVLGRLEVPVCVAQTIDAYVLHPSLMDAALQASIGLSAGGKGSDQGSAGQPMLPFALEEVLVIAPTPARGFALVYRRDGTSNKLDIDICDEQGCICVRLRGFSTRAVTGTSGAQVTEMLLARRVWEAGEAGDVAASWSGPHFVVLCGGDEDRAR
ncbi:polyketide synthase dehydratase domain-containing protein, partial [Bradyrhizobium sp. OK095]|uniref:polyketide synthase dehydratase domain-containing protein n=1 Tax=Bradyrhizobium sp. OK095 TaxID=1882760 RepID=UPI0008D67A43